MSARAASVTGYYSFHDGERSAATHPDPGGRGRSEPLTIRRTAKLLRHSRVSSRMNVQGRPTRTIWPSVDGQRSRSSTRRSCRTGFATARLATVEDAAHAIRAMPRARAPLIGATAAWACGSRCGPTHPMPRSPAPVQRCWPRARRGESPLGTQSAVRAHLGPLRPGSGPPARGSMAVEFCGNVSRNLGQRRARRRPAPWPERPEVRRTRLSASGDSPRSGAWPATLHRRGRARHRMSRSAARATCPMPRSRRSAAPRARASHGSREPHPRRSRAARSRTGAAAASGR